MTDFQKQEFNAEFDHKSIVFKTFSELGFNNCDIVTSLTNGLSHYITVAVDVLNEKILPYSVDVFYGKAVLTVRLSDHSSNLDKMGSCGDKVTFNVFKSLVEAGAIIESK